MRLSSLGSLSSRRSRAITSRRRRLLSSSSLSSGPNSSNSRSRPIPLLGSLSQRLSRHQQQQQDDMRLR